MSINKLAVFVDFLFVKMNPLQVFMFVFLTLVTLVVVSGSDCKFSCENNMNKVCGTSVKPKKYDTVRTFENECFMRKHNCKNPKDGKSGLIF